MYPSLQALLVISMVKPLLTEIRPQYSKCRFRFELFNRRCVGELFGRGNKPSERCGSTIIPNGVTAALVPAYYPVAFQGATASVLWPTSGGTFVAFTLVLATPLNFANVSIPIELTGFESTNYDFAVKRTDGDLDYYNGSGAPVVVSLPNKIDPY